MAPISPRRSPLAACGLLGLLLGAFQVVSGQAAKPQAGQDSFPIQTLSKHSGPLPRAEFGQPSTETPSKQINRQRRESRYRKFFPLIRDPGRLIEGSQETAGLTIIDSVYMETTEQFPTSYSAAILVGTVTSAQGFVSQDRTYVYSDYEIQIDEIFKKDSNAQLAAGGQLTASRVGATVHFPSGHVKRFAILGRGMPKVGAQYVFFLWRPDPGLPEYEIFEGGAFELKDGKVCPLDERGHKFEGFDATVFVDQVKAEIAVAADPGGPVQIPTPGSQDQVLGRPSKHSGPSHPADMIQAQEELPSQQARRQVRELRHAKRHRFIADPGKFVEGQQETVVRSLYDYDGIPSAFPAWASDAVVIGTVAGAKGFVSQDRTYVYTDYYVQVDEVLKQDHATNLVGGSRLIASREGAMVGFPSSHRRLYVVDKQGAPKVGAQYVFFLYRENPDLPEYSIWVSGAYELSRGRAYPLDDYHPELEGLDAAVLIARIKNAISTPK